jgi:hypothetical protein
MTAPSARFMTCCCTHKRSEGNCWFQMFTCCSWFDRSSGTETALKLLCLAPSRTSCSVHQSDRSDGRY